MAKMVYTRSDIQSLAERMLDRSGSSLIDDMPDLQRDIRSAAKILRVVLSVGMPPSFVEIENGNP
jgi:hypothetical protein